MSRFYGVFSLTATCPRTEHLTAMGQSLEVWGSDEEGFWQEGAIALGTALLKVTPQNAFEVQPLVESDFVLVGHVRLDDRESLGHTLGLTQEEIGQLPDSQLLLQAWRKWQANCVDYLYGDWVCAIWDRQQKSLWLGRDAVGNTGLYYWHNAQWLVFSTSLNILLANSLVPKQPNAYHLARQLTVISDPSQDGSTSYQDIYRLAGGQAIRCQGGVLERYDWWHPEQLTELDWMDEEDYFAAFRELYRKAVGDRLVKSDGPVGIMLSSGLDSGSVAALAAPQLKTVGERLLGYISVPYFDPKGASARRLGNETELARATADLIGNIEFIPVSSSQSSVITGIEKMLAIHGLPGHAAGNYYWILDILAQAQNQGVKVLLTGQGGNGTVSWSGTGNLWPALFAGYLNQVASAFHHSSVGLWPIFKQQLLKPILERPFATWQRLKNLGQTPWENYAAISPKLVAEVNLYQRMQAAGHDPFFRGSQQPRSARTSRFRLGQMASAHLGATWMDNGEAYRLEVRDPTRDRRIVEFCWRVPNEVFWGNGVQRSLIRKGMANYLPKSVLYSQRKGLQAADIGDRVLAEREQVIATLDQLSRHPLASEWLDIAKMRRVLDSLESGITPNNSAQTGSILLRGIGVGLFLTRF